MVTRLFSQLRTGLSEVVGKTRPKRGAPRAFAREVACVVAARRWYRTPTLIGVWSISLLAAMPGMGSSVADGTLNDHARSALVLASVNASNPSNRIMTQLAPDAAPLVRMARLDRPDLAYTVGDAPSAVMWLHDTLADERAVEVDLSRLHAAWLALYAPERSQRPKPRGQRSGASLSTSGALAAPVGLAPESMAPESVAPDASPMPVARPEGVSRRAIRYSRDWLRRVALRDPSRQEACLATAIYHEARGETLKGQFAVAEVILNRVASRKFPNSICGVVFQGVKTGQYGGCQFSFACDGKPDELRNRRAADLARRIAQVMADGGHRGLTDGALYFHTTGVNPSWSRRFTQTTQIGAHLFYRG